MRLCLSLFLLILSVTQIPAQIVQCFGQLTVDQLIVLLQGKGSEDRIREIIAVCGIGFSATNDNLARLRSAGATDMILKSVQDRAGQQRWEEFKKSQGLAADTPGIVTAPVARNSQELVQLQLKGERNYIEFTIPQKNQPTKVENIRLILIKTDPESGKYNIRIIIDDMLLEKKDRIVNESVQFLVGPNRSRYELVINWVQKDRAGGYLSIPKDRLANSAQQASNPKPDTIERITVQWKEQQPKLIQQQKPIYPPLARTAHVEGPVQFTAIVGRDGTIQNLELVSGHPLLVPAAQEAVKHWVFQPTLISGKPVEVITQVDLNFRLETIETKGTSHENPVSSVQKVELERIIAAIKNGDYETFRMLLDAGIDAKVRTNEGRSLEELAYDAFKAEKELAINVKEMGEDSVLVTEGFIYQRDMRMFVSGKPWGAQLSVHDAKDGVIQATGTTGMLLGRGIGDASYAVGAHWTFEKPDISIRNAGYLYTSKYRGATIDFRDDGVLLKGFTWRHEKLERHQKILELLKTKAK